MQHQLYIDIPSQTLTHSIDGLAHREYLISTAKNGVGEQIGSEQTPRGWHTIRAKIGEGLAANTVLVGRRPTGEVFTSEYLQQFPNRDWILSRIMWLSGLEKGKNRLGNCDTMRRYIYIHGTPDDKTMGVVGSRGCINMHNDEIIQLFDEVPLKTKVYINE
jgi:lipoprotein-anchoring transpeptidase ErfK/SrfK